MTTTEQKLQSLIARWRAKIADIELKHDMYVLDHNTHIRDTLEECADELTKLLSESPESEPCETH